MRGREHGAVPAPQVRAVVHAVAGSGQRVESGHRGPPPLLLLLRTVGPGPRKRGRAQAAGKGVSRSRHDSPSRRAFERHARRAVLDASFWKRDAVTRRAARVRDVGGRRRVRIHGGQREVWGTTALPVVLPTGIPTGLPAGLPTRLPEVLPTGLLVSRPVHLLVRLSLIGLCTALLTGASTLLLIMLIVGRPSHGEQLPRDAAVFAHRRRSPPFAHSTPLRQRKVEGARRARVRVAFVCAHAPVVCRVAGEGAGGHVRVATGALRLEPCLVSFANTGDVHHRCASHKQR